MRTYVVEFTDLNTGATSPIDTIVTEDGYEAGAYVRECEEYADDDWCAMLREGVVTLVAID